MAVNEVFAGTNSRKFSLGPLVGTVVIGDPVKVGRFVGCVQTHVNTTADDDPVTGNAPNYATIWTDGTYKFTVVVTGTVKLGDPIFAAVTGSNSTVALSNVTGTGKFIFGYAMEPSAAGTVKIAVTLASDAGLALP